MNTSGKRCVRKAWVSTASAAFSMAELMVCVVIIGLLISITITFFEGPRDDARRSMARIETERIVGMIHAWQLEKRTNFRSSAMPPGYHGKPLDPWGQSYRVDPASHSVSSSGPDGVFDSSDDITASWEVWRAGALSALPPPAVSEIAGTSALLHWPAQSGLKSLTLRRSGPDGERTMSLPTLAAQVREDGLVSRATYSYRLEGTDAAGRPLASPEMRLFIPASSPPTLRISTTKLDPKRLRVKVEAQSHGSELAELTIGARTFPLSGANQSVAADLPVDKPGAAIPVSLTDRAGSKTTTDVR